MLNWTWTEVSSQGLVTRHVEAESSMFWCSGRRCSMCKGDHTINWDMINRVLAIMSLNDTTVFVDQQVDGNGRHSRKGKRPRKVAFQCR